MDDEAHIGLVDAHAEGNRGHDDQPFFKCKAALVGPPRVVIQISVIGQGGTAVALQMRR